MKAYLSLIRANKAAAGRFWFCLRVAATVIVLGAAGIGRAQGTFQNLDFEAAKIVIVDGTGYNVATSNALPGWTAFSGTNRLDVVRYNIFTVVPTVGLYGSNSYPVSGTFSVWLADAGSISQNGSVPLTARSLLFKQGTLWYPVPTPGCSLNGSPLPLLPVSSGTNYVLYGADISGFAGQSGTLTLSGGGFLDDIAFSPDVVPEPTGVGLVGVGVMVFIIRFKSRLRTRRPWCKSNFLASPGRADPTCLTTDSG